MKSIKEIIISKHIFTEGGTDDDTLVTVPIKELARAFKEEGYLHRDDVSRLDEGEVIEIITYELAGCDGLDYVSMKSFINQDLIEESLKTAKTISKIICSKFSVPEIDILKIKIEALEEVKPENECGCNKENCVTCELFEFDNSWVVDMIDKRIEHLKEINKQDG